MASRLVVSVSALALMTLSACVQTESGPGEATPETLAGETSNSIVELGSAQFGPPQDDLFQALVLVSEVEPVVIGKVVKVHEADSARIDNEDGSESGWVSTRFVLEVTSVLQGRMKPGETVTVVVPGGLSDHTTYTFHGLPSAEQFQVGTSAVLVLSPLVEGVYPVSAAYPVRPDGTIVSLEGKAQVSSETDLQSLFADARRERQTISAARPHDDEFARMVEKVCSEHRASLLTAKDALTELAGSPKDQGLHVEAFAALEATRTFGADLTLLNPSTATSSAVKNSWAAVLAAIESSSAATELVSPDSGSDIQRAIVSVATAASELESALQRVGAGSCAGFGP